MAMDRSKWEYKKWADVLNIINGRDYKEVVAVDGAYPICGSGGEIGRASEYLCPANTVIIGRKGNINKPLYIEEKFWNIDTAFGLVAKESYLLPRFLFYFCLYYDFERHNKAVTIPSLTKGDLLKIKMLVPIVEDQLRIVAELDCLNEMIAVKQEQLKELDKLAQSIFYDMFWDPVANEKGWDSSCFSNCFKLNSGDGLPASKIVEGDYPVYGGNGIVGYHNEFNLEGGSIIIGRVGALCGNVRYVTGKIFVTDNAFILSKLKQFDNIFLKNLLEILNLRKYAREAMQPVISNKTLKDIQVILPPLALQQQFADKISAIEAQKELIKQSIAETQQLLNSRMDYYFNE